MRIGSGPGGLYTNDVNIIIIIIIMYVYTRIKLMLSWGFLIIKIIIIMQLLRMIEFHKNQSYNVMFYE